MPTARWCSTPATLAPTTDRNLQTRGNAAFLTMKPADFRVDPRHVQLLDNDTIVASGVLSFTANVGAARPVLKTRYTQVYQRQPDGSFKIVHEHMSVAPAGNGRAMSAVMTGGCACGAVRFEAEIDSDEAYLCHCRMCQRATGSVSIAFKNLPQAKMRWLAEPDWYDSSPIARRPYCARCGTSLGFQFKEGAEPRPHRRRVRRSFAVQADLALRRRKHARRVDRHRRTCRAPAPTSIRNWSTNGSPRPARCPTD